MWHEVRKQERKIRCMIVDYKRRAERRKDYYEKIKADPTQFLQVHGRPCKIHWDANIAAAGDSSVVMMNWAGSPEVLIDRFDVRAHLDCIPESKNSNSDDDQLSYDERYVNYERYRILVQNDFIGVSEEKFLNQLSLEEQYGASSRTGFVPPPIEGKKKVPGAAIGYNYDDGTSNFGNQGPSVSDIALPPLAPPGTEDTEVIPPLSEATEDDQDRDEEDDDDDSDLDFDVCVDVNQVTTQQAHELNNSSHAYGMEGNDFFSFLTKDKEEAENLRIAKEIEEEKSMYSGRKSRRERRLYREKQLAGRKISPPSYASRRSPTYNDYKDQLRCNSRSRSPSPDNSGRITYITSFGEEEQNLADINKPTCSPSINDKKKAGSFRRSPAGSSFSQYHGKYRYGPTSHSPEHYGGRSWSPNHSHRSPDRRNHRISRSPGRYRRHSPFKNYASRSPGRYRRRSRSPGRLGRYTLYDKNSPIDKYSSREKQSPRDRHTSTRDGHPSSRDKYPSTRDRHSPAHVHQSYSRRTPTPPSTPVYLPKPRLTTNNKQTFGAVKTDPIPSPPFQQAASVPRYYGRRIDKSSSSELSWSESEDTCNSVSNSEKLGSSDIGNASGRSKPACQSGISNAGMRERLKRKRQILLQRQFKADKKAEKEKQERVEQERIDREDEMREMSIKLRKRERQKRHEYYAELERLERRSRSRSKSRSRRSSSSSSSSSNRSRYRRRRKRSNSSKRSCSRSSSSNGGRRKKSPKGLVDY